MTYPSATKGAQASNAGDYERRAYDANGNVTSRRLRDGTSVTLSYDALNRVTGRTPPTGGGYAWDVGVTYRYDLSGRLLQVTRGDGQSVVAGLAGLVLENWRYRQATTLQRRHKFKSCITGH